MRRIIEISYDNEGNPIYGAVYDDSGNVIPPTITETNYIVFTSTA
jgi:hypothetical protein